MDTSLSYIKMCEKAEELQVRALIREQDDNIFYVEDTVIRNDLNHTYKVLLGKNNFNHTVICKMSDTVVKKWDSLPEYVEDTVWLPRLDQLQEIWMKETKKLHIFEAVIRQDSKMSQLTGDQSLKRLLRSEHIRNISLEQIWLDIVMEDLFRKVWDYENKKWITF